MYVYINKKVKLVTIVEGDQKAPFSIATGRVLLFSFDCSTLSSIRTLYCWVLSKEVSSTIFKVFGIEPWFPGLNLGFRDHWRTLYPLVQWVGWSKVGNQKAPFSIASTPRCRGGCYSFSWIAPLYPWYAPYIAKC